MIYQTNMRTSYAAAFRQQLRSPAMIKIAPYWRYVHSDGVMHPRPQHLAWDGLTLRHDHPFWAAHSPPNGWGCQCRITPVTPEEYEQSDYTAPPEGWDAIDPKTGAPPGIDEGWDYAPGARADDDLRTFVQDKLIDYPPAISTALSRDVTRFINAEDKVPDFVRGVLADRQRTDPLWLGFVDTPQRVSQVAGVDVTGYTVLLPADAPRHVQDVHGYDGQGQRPARPDDFAHLIGLLNDTATVLRPGAPSRNNTPTVVATGNVSGEIFRAVWAVLPGKRNRALQLISLAIKT